MVMNDTPDKYLTIASPAEGLYKDKGSRFLAFAMPVETPEQVKQQLSFYKKKYYDARHVCYAYMLGADRKEYRCSDDGEPNGTAGRPILGQINSNNLTNILIVVVRYFGGILLGTGGLVVAYKEAAADAIKQAQIVEKDVLVRKTIEFPYEKMNDIMRTLKDIDAKITRQQFDNVCIIECLIKRQYEGRI